MPRRGGARPGQPDRVRLPVLGAHQEIPEAPAAVLAPPADVPTELNMVALPPYAIGSPDVLLISVYTLPRDKGARRRPRPAAD